MAHTYSEDREQKELAPKSYRDILTLKTYFSTSDNQNGRPDYPSDYKLGL